MRLRRAGAVAIALLLLAASACYDSSGSISRSEDAVRPTQCASSTAGRASSVDLRGLIEAVIAGRDAALGAVKPAERAELQQLYRPGDSPLWLDAARPTRSAHDALNLLSHAADDGLDPSDYYRDFLSQLAPRVETELPDPDDLARFDVAVSAGTLRYLRHLHMGRVDPRAIGFRLDAPRDRHDFPALLRAAITDQRVTLAAADLRPPLAQYRLLRDMLARYRSVASDPTLVALPPFEATIQPGEQYEASGDLRRELAALGDLRADTVAPPESGRYEGALVEGVRRFQVRHGLGSRWRAGQEHGGRAARAAHVARPPDRAGARAPAVAASSGRRAADRAEHPDVPFVGVGHDSSREARRSSGWT